MSELENMETEDAVIEQHAPQLNPALTIVVHSWMTPVVGVLMLALGLLGGFFLRPLVAGDTQPPSPQVSVEQQPAVSGAQNPNSGEIMQLVSQQTRHFIGSETAPVTIIEFSDFL